ncbi:GGDEF domain-containing response regulator [Nautilia sp.]
MKILIIEDNLLYRKLLEKNINKYLFFATCKSVTSFNEMINLSDLENYDLYLCDYILPDAFKGEQIDFLLKFTSDIIVMTQFEKEFIRYHHRDKIIDFIVKDDYHTIDYLIRFVKRLYRNRKINLLMLDEKSELLYIKKNILTKINLNVFEATDAKTALKILEDIKIDIVITDLDISGFNGQDFIISVREKYNMAELPVIVLSSETVTNRFLKTLKLGANDFLKKPFLKEELILRVNNLLEIYESVKRVKKQVKMDPLTGSYNRMFLEDNLENVFNLTEYKSIAMLDIDFFKKINDTYGHQTGDEILKHFVKTIKNTIRKSDYVIRYGGEEFLLYMPDTTKEEAMIVLYKIKKNLLPYKNIYYTFSAGIANEGETLAEMVKKADERLYRAKKSGRNKIVVK